VLYGTEIAEVVAAVAEETTVTVIPPIKSPSVTSVRPAILAVALLL